MNNSPERLFFKLNMIKGKHSSFEEENEVMTPAEVGVEQTMRVFTMEPEEGYIDCYSQIPMKVTCFRKTEEDHKIWVNTYSLAKGEVYNEITKEMSYTCAMTFSQGPGDPHDNNLNRIVQLEAFGACPKVILSQSEVQFGECFVTEQMTQSMTVSNQSGSDISLTFPNLSHYSVDPQFLKLAPQKSKEIQLKFSPRNLGKLRIASSFLVNNIYPIGFTFDGRGIPKPLPVSKSMVITKKTVSLNSSSLDLRLGDVTRSQAQLKFPSMMNPLKASSKFEYLRDSRHQRLAKIKRRKLNKQLTVLETKIQENKAFF